MHIKNRNNVTVSSQPWSIEVLYPSLISNQTQKLHKQTRCFGFVYLETEETVSTAVPRSSNLQGEMSLQASSTRLNANTQMCERLLSLFLFFNTCERTHKHTQSQHTQRHTQGGEVRHQWVLLYGDEKYCVCLYKRFNRN